MIGTDLSKQKELDADTKAIQQINITANLNSIGNERMFFIIDEAKGYILGFSKGTVKIL